MKVDTLKMLSDVAKARYDNSYLLTWMPKEARTSGQKELQSKHGTPYEFACECLDAIGEISVEEARAAIKKYRHQWEFA